MTRIAYRLFLVAFLVIGAACRSGDVSPQVPRVAGSAATQGPPDFSGTWTLDAGRGTASGGGRGGGGQGRGTGQGGGLGLGPSPDTLVVSQSTTVLRIEERYGVTQNTVQYALDGKPTSSSVGVGRGEGAPVSFTTSWKGNRLVSTFSVSPRGAPAARQYEELRYLEPDGALVVETRQAGGGMRRAVYVRAKK